MLGIYRDNGREHGNYYSYIKGLGSTKNGADLDISLAEPIITTDPLALSFAKVQNPSRQHFRDCWRLLLSRLRSSVPNTGTLNQIRLKDVGVSPLRGDLWDEEASLWGF